MGEMKHICWRCDIKNPPPIEKPNVGQKADDYPKWLNNIPNQIEDRIVQINKKEDRYRSPDEKQVLKEFKEYEKEQEKI